MRRILTAWTVAWIMVLALNGVGEARISPESAFSEGMKAYARNDYNRAVEEFSKAVWYYIEEKVKKGWPMGPNDHTMGAQAYLYRGMSYMKLGKPGDAVMDFQMAEKWSGETSEALLKLGDAYFRLGKYDDSIRVLSALIEKSPNMGMAHYYVARSLYMKHDYEASWKHVKTARSFGVPIIALLNKLRKAAPQFE